MAAVLLLKEDADGLLTEQAEAIDVSLYGEVGIRLETSGGLWDAALWDAGVWGADGLLLLENPDPFAAESLLLLEANSLLVVEPGQPLRWLGGLIDVRVELDTGLGPETGGLWDEALWDAGVWGSTDPSWFDISEFVELVTIGYGAERWGDRFQAGTASIVLNNNDGRFTPDSGVDPFHLPFRPGRRIRVVAIPDPEADPSAEPSKVALFTGYVDDSGDDYTAGDDITTTVTCYDQMAIWAEMNFTMLTTATGVQTTDVRVDAALDRALWPTLDRDIQTGVHTMQTSFLAQSILEECQRAADAEGGAFYMAPDGIPTFKARDWLIVDDRSVNIQGYLGYVEAPVDSNQAIMLNPVPSWERARVVNKVAFARVGSTMQTVEDIPSQNVNGFIRAYERTDLECNTDAQVANLAARYLTAFADLRLRLDSVTYSGVADPNNDDLNRLLWDVQLGDRIAVRVEPVYGWSYEKQVHVMAVAHEITADDWLVTVRLDDALTYEG